MAASTQDEIAILVANHLGEEDVNGTLSDSSETAINRLVNERFAASARWVLTQHDWQFAKKRAVLRTLADQRTITGITAADPAVFTTSTDHDLAVNDLVKISDISSGPTTLNDTDYLVNSIPLSTTFTLKDLTDDANTIEATSVGSDGTVRKKPAFEWENAYDTPSDNLRIMQVDKSLVGWEEEGNQILTDNKNIEVEYVYDKDLTVAGALVDEAFNEALSLKIAWEITPVINQDESLRRTLAEELKKSLRKARFIDSTKRGRIIAVANDFENSRRTGSGHNNQKVGKLF